MKVEGGCFCQSLRYEAVVDPETVAICHCTDCQTHSGAAYGVVVGILEEEFHLLSGELKIYKKVADSGTVRALAFCPDCGTRLYAKTVGEGSTFFGLRVGTVRQRDQLAPKRQIWCQSAQGWVHNLQGIPQHEKQPLLG